LVRADLTGAKLRDANLNLVDAKWANFSGADLGAALLYEADLSGANLAQANLTGARLGRARLQLFRPASLRIREAIPLHLGPDAELALDPPLVSFDPKSGRELHIAIRNNYPSIQNYVIDVSGKGLTLLPGRTEVSVAAATEREIAVRIFSDDTSSGLRDAVIHVTGAADIEQHFQALPLGRGETVAYARDLDGDGAEDRVLENQRVRASFSGVDGRWMEWVWKDSNTSYIHRDGTLANSDAARSVPAETREAAIRTRTQPGSNLGAGTSMISTSPVRACWRTCFMR